MFKYLAAFALLIASVNFANAQISDNICNTDFEEVHRTLTEKYYNWDNIALKWEKDLDNIQLTGLQGKWSSVLPAMKAVQMEDKGNAYDTILDFVSNSMPGHQLLTSMQMLNMIQDVDYGYTMNGMQSQGYSLKDARKIVDSLIENHNIAMKAKDNISLLPKEDFIEYANMKDQTK